LVLPVMPALEMLVNNTLHNNIEAVKKYAWPMEGKQQFFISEGYGGTSNSLGPIHDHRSAYGQIFWITCNSTFPMFNYIESKSLEGLRTYFECLDRGCRIEFSEILEMYETNVKSIPDGQVVSHLESVWRSNKNEIIDTVKAIATKTIGGDFNFDQFSLTKNRTYLLLASNFIDFKIQTDFVKGVELNETSAILNINHLQAEFDLADIEAKIGGLVYSALKREGRRVHMRTPSTTKGPVEPISLFTNFVDFIPAAWTEETLKMKLPEECRAGINSSEVCPDIETEGDEAVIKIFEVKYT
jgi:hypothetical protein